MQNSASRFSTGLADSESFVLFRCNRCRPGECVATEFGRREAGFGLVSYAILGGVCSVLGGYVSARIAKHDELLNGANSSILCVGGGTYAVISGSAADDLWMHLVCLPLSPALGALGGYLRSRQAARIA